MIERKQRRKSPIGSLFPILTEPVLDAQFEDFNEEFKNAATITDLNKLVQKIDHETQLLDAELVHFVEVASKKHTLEISTVELTRAKLSGAITNSNDLTKVFTSTSDLGHTLTSKIKALDQEIGNVESTLAFVSDVKTLKNNINQTMYAIEKKDWEQAAQCINTINHKLSPTLVKGQFASVVIPSSDIPELPAPTIQKWIGQLTEEFQNLFNDAAKRRSVPEITKYFQLFPLIDQAEVGLNCYSKFICSIITDSSRTLINSAPQDEAKLGVYANITMSLFESVSMMLSQHSPLIIKYYGETYPTAVVYVVNKIQREIDSQIGLIADTFYDMNRLDKLLQDIKLHSFSALKRRLSDQVELDNMNEVFDNDIVSIVEVGDLIHELAAILHHWSLYCKFVVMKYFNNSADHESSKEEGLKLPDMFVNSNFNKKIHNKYLPAFEALYTFYSRRSLEKAIAIEDLPSLEPYLVSSRISKSPEQAPVSSVIEDLTLVFHNTFSNVLDSAQPSTVKHFITEYFKMVQNDLFHGFFQKVLAENQPRYNNSLTLQAAGSTLTSGMASPGMSRTGTPAPESMGGFFKGASSALGNVVGTGSAIVSSANSGASPNNPKLMHFIIYLNTIATGQEFLEQIVDNVTKKNPMFLKNNFPFGIDEEKINHIIEDELITPFANATSNMIKQALLNFFNQSFKNRIVGMIIDCFPESSETHYVVYSSSTLSDNSTVLKFKLTWDSIIKPCRQTLHKTLVYDKLLRLLVVNIANLIEKRMLLVMKKHKINELGALKMDKDLSYIINEICEDDYDLREKFVRVTQLVLLVGMDNEEYELSTYTGDGEEEGINWVLTPLERRQIRRLRI